MATELAVREVGGARDPLALVEALRARHEIVWLLDSALEDDELGRWSFLGADPYWVVRARGDRLVLECRRPVRPGPPLGHSERRGDPLALVRALMPERPSAVAPVPFAGGAVGWLGYELGEHTEPVVLHGRDDVGLPDLALLFVDRLLAIDHREDRTYALGLGFPSGAEAAREEMACLAEALPAAGPARVEPSRALRREVLATPVPASAECDFDASGYAKAVEAVRDEIAAGEVYQANLTQRLTLPCEAEPWAVYRALRERSPAPFAAYLQLPEAAVLSSSPERFLRLRRDGRVESRPIKGTRPRGESAAADLRLADELARSEKDRAENLMITDLVRNDLGRVCETGSVAVPELMAILRYASVFQMVSTVTGRLREDRDWSDLLRATFPPGSMTGAPKIAAMRILDRLEPVRRGVYSGALGYLDVAGGMDWSVVIRTLLRVEGRAVLHVGGGVVADSDPHGEWAESIDKARALLAALAAANG